jgi:hypothetical protein
VGHTSGIFVAQYKQGCGHEHVAAESTHVNLGGLEDLAEGISRDVLAVIMADEGSVGAREGSVNLDRMDNEG